jgi:two-component system phosphate regulon sensor histidine kinase PhoR
MSLKEAWQAWRRPTANEMGWTSPEQARGVRVVRLIALLPVMVISLGISAKDSNDVVDGPFLCALVVFALATVLTFTASYARFTPWVMLAVPAGDLVAVCALSLVPGMEAVAVLVAVPAMWLGGIFRWRGVAGVVVLSTAAYAVLAPRGLGSPLGGETVAASVITLAVLSSGLMVIVVTFTARQLRRLEEQGAALTRALALAEKTEQRLNVIVNTVDVALATVETDASYTSLNPRHLEFVDLVFPDGDGRTAGVGYVYAADNATLLTADQLPSLRASRGESFTDYAIWIGKDPLRRRAIRASGRPILDQLGEFTGAVLSYNDITDLMTALRVKDDFVALVSHELRTPLTSIIGYLELTSEHELPPDVTDELSVISRNAERLLHLVTDLLAAGTSDISSMRLVKTEVDLSQLVTLTLASCAPVLHDAQLDMHTEIQPGVHLLADTGRLTQVIDKLLSNAIKYTPPGGTITVSVAAYDGAAEVLVSDTGIGISEPDQSGLATKFFRARNATERAIPGVGLGLAITKAIIDAHDGTITLDSHEGLGTTVHVTLPDARVEQLLTAH